MRQSIPSLSARPGTATGPLTPTIVVGETHRNLAKQRPPGTIALNVATADEPPRTVIELVADARPRLVECVIAAVAAAGLDIYQRIETPIAAQRDPEGQLLAVSPYHSGAGQSPDRTAETWLTLETDLIRDPERVAELQAAIREAVSRECAGGDQATGLSLGLSAALAGAEERRLADFLLRRLGGLGVDHSAPDQQAVPQTLHLMWDETVRELLAQRYGCEPGSPGVALDWQHQADLGEVFPDVYKGSHTPREAVDDLERVGALATDRPLLAWLRRVGQRDGEIRFRVYRLGDPMILSDILSVLHSFGVRVTDERAFEIRPGREVIRLYDFGLQLPPDAPPLAETRQRMEDAFVAAWRADSEVDPLNSLVVTAALTWSQVAVLRGYTRYLCQLGTRFSRSDLENALREHPAVASRLVELFEARFDPGLRLTEPARRHQTDELVGIIERLLDEVASLDHDQIIRGYLNVIMATSRTTAFQRSAPAEPSAAPLPGSGGSGAGAASSAVAPYFAVKLDSPAIDLLPAPRPQYEIFVHSPRFEGVHLRFGKVARGGLRWSDRGEDFRTEVLGLVKAQMIKNAVIVPTGAKGGFVLKTGSGPQEAAACYRLFISALLDLTDNIVDGTVLPPPQTIRYDGDDPYLVVAAEKGTASFSDLANAVACERGFWLGDAFASGGSAGYDHKAMGITARGAWESVRHAFRELGTNVDSESITAVGIGDMSGDVFGNGMLLSPQLRLIAAFDHRSIFLDPAPDPAAAFAERRRLFELPRSSWQDYDRSLISAGGGVWPRSAKNIPLSPQARAALGLADTEMRALTPVALIRAILAAPVDLLFNGGIGTYVKASEERHPEVGDRTNDRIRINGRDLRARVVCEGGNLGLTQRGRIEFAKAGGLITTDFIDNSAGVDCSDHEVNIKIMLERAIAAGQLERGKRDSLLASMTDEVAGQVLRDNYQQAAVLGLARQQAATLLPVHVRMIEEYERAGHLDRVLEGMPDAEELSRRAAAGAGLTTPELAVLLAYTKILVSNELRESPVPDEEWIVATLVDYFPTPLREPYRAVILEHPLRREIIATRLANEMVNRGGISMVFRAVEETGCTVADVARAWAVVKELFDLPVLWRSIELADHAVPVAAQNAALIRLRRLVDRSLRWFVTHQPSPLDVVAEAERRRAEAARLLPGIEEILGERERLELRDEVATLTGLGLPADLSQRVAAGRAGFRLLDISDIALQTGHDVGEVARVYAAVAQRMRAETLLCLIAVLPRPDRWQTLARMALRADVYEAVAGITTQVLSAVPERGIEPERRVDRWAASRGPVVTRLVTEIDGLETGGADLAALSVVVRSLRSL